MFETSGTTKKFFDNVSGFQTSISDRTPTFERTLDNYFDKNADAVIEEWGLVTKLDLAQYQRKLEFLSYEVGRLNIEKESMKKRALMIEKAISELEGKV